MKKLKVILAFIMAFCMCGAVSGCAGDSDTSVTSEKADESKTEESKDSDVSEYDEEVTESEKSEVSEAKGASFELTDNVLDGRITLGDETLALPCSLSGLYDSGWTDSNEGGSDTNLKKNGNCISVRCDKEDEDKVIAITCYFGFNENEVKLPKNVILGKTLREDVLAAYGEPDNYFSADSPDPNAEKDFDYVMNDANGETDARAFFRFAGNTTNPDYVDGAAWGFCIEKRSEGLISESADEDETTETSEAEEAAETTAVKISD